MKEGKILVKIILGVPAHVEFMADHYAGKLDVVFTHLLTIYRLSMKAKPIVIRLTPDELRKINLREKGKIGIDKLGLYLPFWAISEVYISTDPREVPPQKRHWAPWSRFPLAGNCDYLNT